MKKKHKFLKTFSFASLALLMGVAGTMAFAPLGASPGVANANEMIESTTEQGLITPKADDPVIYTTESGLEIKYGNAIPSTIHSSLGSGNLAGFPYFTTSKDSTTYAWVIIGRNSNVTTINKAQSFLFSTWEANSSTGNKLVLGNHFFDNTYETTTPAGSAINNVVPSKSYVYDTISFSINDITTNDNEIPSGCMLVLSNIITGSVVYQNTSNTSGWINNINQTFQGSANKLRPVFEDYATNDTFGFGSLLDSIQTTTLTQRTFYYNSGGSTLTANTATVNLKFFPLGAKTEYDNFVATNYLTAEQIKSSSAFWSRSMNDGYKPYQYTTAGVVANGTNSNGSLGVRPAFVLKIT